MFGNTNDDPSDIFIETNASNGTISATFDVHDVLGFGEIFDKNDLLTSTETTLDQFFFGGLTASPVAPPLFGAPALPADSTFTLPFSAPLLSLQGKLYRFNFNLPTAEGLRCWPISFDACC